MSAPVPLTIDEKAAELERRLAAGRFPARPIVVYGSSTVRMWPNPEALGRADVVAVGFGGATLRNSIEWYGRLVRPLGPRHVVVATGVNDMEKDGVDPKGIVERAFALVALARMDAPAPALSFLTMKPSPFHDGEMALIRETNALLAERLPWVGAALIDTFSPFIGVNGMSDPRFYGPDRHHFNAEGYAVWNATLRHALPPVEPG